MAALPLELITVQMAHKEAMQRGNSELQKLLGIILPDGWPQFPEAFAVQADGPQPSEDWLAFFFVHRPEQLLVGNGGFAGAPDESGEVEIGYEIAPMHQNHGFATAAVNAMIAIAFARPEVSAVVAHTLAEENASNRVLRKVGKSFAGELPNAEVAHHQNP